MHSKSRWAASWARSIPASKVLRNSRILPPAISIRQSSGGSRCSAPAAFAAKRPRAICCRAVSPRSITSRAVSSIISKACLKRRAAGEANVLSSTIASRSATDCGSGGCKRLAKRLAMSDEKALGERIDALEARLMFQDETIETLNRTITEQWRKIDALTRKVVSLSERLQEAEARAPRPGNEP